VTVLLPLLIAIGIASSMLLWVSHGLPEFPHLAYHAIAMCKGVFAQCIAYSSAARLALLWLGAMVLVTGFFFGVIRAAAGLVKTRRAIKRLPLSRRCGSVVLIRDFESRTAFTHGLIKPTIYMSTGLLASLDRDEIRAVFLHELHHKRGLDPLRFFMLAFLRDVFFYIPLVKYLAGYVRLRKEQEADDAARASAETLTLAGALLKVAAFQKEMAVMTASITGGTEGGAVSARIRRLVEGKDVGFKPPAARTMAMSLLITAVLALSFAMPLSANTRECTKKQCAMHPVKAVEAHCKLLEHRR